MKRKIAAILAADVAGYSRLIAEDEEETLRRLSDYQGVFKSYIERAGGRIFKTAGDSILAEFPSAVDALRCAIDVQESLRSRNLAYPMSRQMAYRIGLTIGDVVEQDGDLLGDGVNIAARLESLAQPGGICISKGMHDAVSSKLSVKYIDMGSHQVKNIPLPVHVFSVSSDPRASSVSNSTPEVNSSFEPQVPRAPRSRPPLAVLAASVAVGSALVVYLLPQLSGPSADKKTADAKQTELLSEKTGSAATPATESQKPLMAATSDSSASTSAPADITHEAATDTTPPVSAGASSVPSPQASSTHPNSGEKVDAGTQSLRAKHVQDCNSEDTGSALEACKILIADASIKSDLLARAQRNLGYAQRKNGDMSAALNSFNNSIATLATADAYNNRGITYFLNGKLSDAIADYNEAIRLDANLADAWNNRAWTYYKSGRLKDALADADKAVSLDGGKAYVWDTRAHIHEALGDLKSATADFEKSLSIDPGLASSKSGLKRVSGR